MARRAPRACGRERTARRRRRRAAGPTRSCTPPRASAPRELSARGARPGARVAIALPAGLAFAQALHACLLLGAVAVPVDLRLSRRRARRGSRTAARVSVEEPLGRGAGTRRRPRRALARTTSTPTAVVIHTSGTTAAPRAGRADVRQPAVERARLGRRARRRPATSAGCARCRSRTSAACRSCVRSAIYATTRCRARALRDRPRAATRCASERDHARQPRRHDARAAARRRPASAAAAALRADRRRPRAGRAASARARDARRAGQPHLRAHRGLLAGRRPRPLAAIGARRAGAGPPLFCTRVRIAADGEILVRRPDRRPGARSPPTAGCTPAISARSTSAGRLHVSGRKADTIVSGGENVAPAEVEAVLEAHADVLEAAVLGRAGRAVGRGGDRDRRRAPSGLRRTPRSCARHCARGARRLQGAQARRDRARAAAAHALGQAAAQGARDELRRQRPPRARASRAGKRPPPGWVRRQALLRELGRAGVALDDRRDRAAARPARARAGGRPRRDRRCSPPSSSRRSAASIDLRPGRGDARRARARARPSWASATSSSRCSTPNGSTCRVASVDGVLCRWGYMLMADPAAALSRRGACCAPAGALALAVWDAIERNPWALLPAQELSERGLAPRPQDAGTPGPFALAERGRVRRAARATRASPRSSSTRSSWRRRHPSFEELWEIDARPLAQLPRRRARAARRRDRGDPRVARAALCALHRRRRRARDPGAHARRLRRRLSPRAPTGERRAPGRAPRSGRMRILDSLRGHDLRRRRRPHAPRRQDRRHHRLRLTGPRPRAQPQGLRRRRRRRAARGLRLGRRRARAGPRGAVGRRRRQPRRPRDDPAARRAPPPGVGGGDPRRHRRGQHDPVRPRLLDPLRRGRAAAGRRRRDGRAQGPRPPRAPPVHRRQRRARA